jgi:hypothetical protein
MIRMVAGIVKIAQATTRPAAGAGSSNTNPAVRSLERSDALPLTPNASHHLVIRLSCSAVVVPIKEHDSGTAEGLIEQNRKAHTEL